MGLLNRLLGIQECQSVHGEHVDWMMELVHWFMLLLGLGWMLFLGYVFVRYHKSRQPKAIHSGVQSHATTHIEVGVIITEIILLLGFAFPLWGQRVDDIPVPRFPGDPEIVQVRAVAQQFSWTFHYPGTDGIFGNTDPRFITSWNTVGIDPEDVNGKDDLLATGELAAPVNKKVIVGVTSKDVIHNLALKAARVATDANPGSINRVWFQPTKAGATEIICGQLCGPGHGTMKAMLNIMKDDKEFEGWLGDQVKFETQIPGYKPPAPPPAPEAAKPAVPAAAASAASTATPVAASANEGVHQITIGVVPGAMKYDTTEFTVAPGEKARVTLKNEKCALEHNILICKPGTLQKVIAAAVREQLNPNYPTTMQAVPNSEDILFKGNKLVKFGQEDSFEFTVPAVEGDYPYVCTFPGHMFLMNGVMHVKK